MAQFRNLSGTQWEIVRAFCNGDLEAGVRTLRKYSPAIREFIARKGFANQVDEFEQQTYLKIIDWITSPTFNPDKSHFRSLVLTCILRTIAGEMRKVGGRPKELALEDIHEAKDRTTWDEVYVENIRTKALAEVKQRVESETWAAFELLQNGKTAEEVAVACGRSKQWVYDLNARVMKMFREACLELDQDAI